MLDDSRLRIRKVPNKRGSTPVKTGDWDVFFGGKWQPNGPQTVPQVNPYEFVESTRDEKHKRDSNGVWLGGGPFLNIKVSMPKMPVQGIGTYSSEPNSYWVSGVGFVPIRYRGGFYNPQFTGDNYSDADYANVEKITGTTFAVPSLDVWSTEAWAKTAPKLEKASGFTALAESRDTAPMLSTTAKGFSDIWETARGVTQVLKQKGGKGKLGIMAPGAISDQYLNHQFGWAPFISDCRQFLDNNQKFMQYYDRMIKYNGKWRHYRRTLLDDVKRTKLASGSGMRCSPSGYIFENLLLRPGSYASWEVWEETYSLIQTSGVFRWYVPDADMNYPNNYPELSVLYAWLTMQGLRVSPSSVWRATPWSWLADWQFHIGRNLDRITEALYDGVVCKYLYLTGHTIRRVVLYQYMPFIGGDRMFTFDRRIEIKQRKEAGSPFGFDSPWETLTPWRLSILAALGISRSSPR